MDFIVDSIRYPLIFAPSQELEWSTFRLGFSDTRKISSLCLESNDSINGFLLDRIEIQNSQSTSVKSITHKEVFVYPNPAEDEIYIKGLLSNQSYRISFYSLEGKLLKDINSNSFLNQPIVVKIKDIHAGTYFLLIENKTGTIARRIILMTD